MEIWIIWIIIAGVLLIVELLTQMMWSLFLAIGAVFAMVAALLGFDLGLQLCVLVVASLVAFPLLGPILKKRGYLRMAQRSRDTKTGMDALLGRKAVITHEIKPGELGRGRIDGDNWQVRAPGVKTLIPRGTEVVVTGYDSIILDVAL